MAIASLDEMLKPTKTLQATPTQPMNVYPPAQLGTTNPVDVPAPQITPTAGVTATASPGTTLTTQASTVNTGSDKPLTVQNPLQPIPTPTALPSPTGTLTTTAQPGQPSPWGPATQPAPLPNNVGGQQFGPGSNLIGTQINPVNLDQYLAQLNEARQAAGAYTPGADTTMARDVLNQQLTGLSQMPDRGQIASDQFQNLLDQAKRDEFLGIQNAGRAGARLGRLGSGMVTTDIGNLEGVINQRLIEGARGLSADTAAQSLQDRINALNASGGAYNQLAGQDLIGANYGLNRSAALAGLAGQGLSAQESGRQALVGERGYQQGLDQQALQNRIGETTLAQQLANDQLNRQLAYNSLLGGYGYAAPGSVYQDVANQYGQQAGAAGSSAADLFKALLEGGYLGGGSRNATREYNNANNVG